jgi:hypothetical protein
MMMNRSRFPNGAVDRRGFLRAGAAGAGLFVPVSVAAEQDARATRTIDGGSCG